MNWAPTDLSAGLLARHIFWRSGKEAGQGARPCRNAVEAALATTRRSRHSRRHKEPGTGDDHSRRNQNIWPIRHLLGSPPALNFPATLSWWGSQLVHFPLGRDTLAHPHTPGVVNGGQLGRPAGQVLLGARPWRSRHWRRSLLGPGTGDRSQCLAPNQKEQGFLGCVAVHGVGMLLQCGLCTRGAVPRYSFLCSPVPPLLGQY